MKKHNVVAMMIAASFLLGCAAANAAGTVKKITAETHSEYVVMVNNEKQTLISSSGKTGYPIYYNNEVYLPASALADAPEFGCSFDKNKSTISLTSELINLKNDGSSMTDKIAKELEGVAVFWAPTGNKIHLDYNCQTFKLGVAYAGTIDEAVKVRADGFCSKCSAGANVKTYKANTKATVNAIEHCYTFGDYEAQIPESAYKKKG